MIVVQDLWFSAGGDGGSVAVTQRFTGKPLHLSQAHKASVNALAFWDGEGDDAVLASGDVTGCVSIHRLQGSIGQTQVPCSQLPVQVTLVWSCALALSSAVKAI